jgi:hypothetical protein
MGESSSFTPALSPLVVHFVAGQGMTIKFLEALKTGNRPEIFLNRIGHSIRPQFQASSLVGYEREMHAVHFHKIGREKFPSSLERKNHKGGGL